MQITDYMLQLKMYLLKVLMCFVFIFTLLCRVTYKPQIIIRVNTGKIPQRHCFTGMPHTGNEQCENVELYICNISALLVGDRSLVDLQGDCVFVVDGIVNRLQSSMCNGVLYGSLCANIIVSGIVNVILILWCIVMYQDWHDISENAYNH